jgi:hypothetical protein
MLTVSCCAGHRDNLNDPQWDGMANRAGRPRWGADPPWHDLAAILSSRPMLVWVRKQRGSSK